MDIVGNRDFPIKSLTLAERMLIGFVACHAVLEINGLVLPTCLNDV